MAKNRKGTSPILMDIHYKHPLNTFEEFYGDWISYSEIEQVSYIDLKEMVFSMIGRGVRFRKFGRDGGILTVKADMKPDEYELFLSIYKGEEIDEEATSDEANNPEGEIKYKKFRFLHDFIISNVRELTVDEKLRFKKITQEEAKEQREDEDEDED